MLWSEGICGIKAINYDLWTGKLTTDPAGNRSLRMWRVIWSKNTLNVRKVSDAVKRVVEKEKRGKKVVICGVPERSTETLETRVGNIMDNVGQKPRIVDCCRLGKETEGSVRPLTSEGNPGKFICCCRSFEKLKVAEKRRSLSTNFYLSWQVSRAEEGSERTCWSVEKI